MNTIGAATLANSLLRAAEILRGKLDASENSQIISAMLLLKWASDQPGQLAVPERARWNRLADHRISSPSGALNEALAALVDNNSDLLEEVSHYLDSTKKLGRREASELIFFFDQISLKTTDLQFEDVVGRAYDQVIERLADAAGKRGGDFYTPRSVIQLMVRLARLKSGQSVYDPFAGSGGMLTSAAKYVAERAGEHGALDLFAQEVNRATCGVARLNLLFHGAGRADIRCGDTLANPLHSIDDEHLQRFDRILTNPPFSVNYLQDDVNFPERMRYGWTRKSDLMFVQHVLSTLAPDGIGVMVTPHGVLFRGGTEKDIRRGIILDGRIEALIGIGPNVFHGTSIPACILVLRGENEAARATQDVLFINAEHEITTGRSRNHLDPRHIEKIVHAFQERRKIPHFSRVVSLEEISSNDFNLNIRHYVDPSPSPTRHADSQALLFGGVPKSEFEAQRKHFQAFGIDAADLFAFNERGDDRSSALETPHHLQFPPHGFEAVVDKIPRWAAASEHMLLGRLRAWLNRTRPEFASLGSHTLPVVRDELMKSFRSELLPLTILDEYQLIGVFADWWAANHDGIREMSRTLQDAATRPGMIEMTQRTSSLDALEEDLVARVKYLVAAEREKLVEVYRHWGDLYGTSLRDLEKMRKMSADRMKSRLRELGYDWPDGV
jgi:type I restriction enzyme M protein